MTLKITVSATKQNEFEEVMQALKPVVQKRGYRVKKKPPAVPGKTRYTAYINSRDMLATCEKV